MKNFKVALFQEIVQEPTSILLLVHRRPDGDALGSALALHRLLKREGHQVTLMSPTAYDAHLAWMPDIEKVKVYDKQHSEKVNQIFQKAKIVIGLDFSHSNQIEELMPYLKNHAGPIYSIDHHPHPEDWVTLLAWDDQAASTTLLIYRLLCQIEKQAYLQEDLSMATLLYVGLLTDTGLFQHANTTPEAHKMAAELLQCGVRPKQLYRQLFATQSLRKLKFLGHSLYHRLVRPSHKQWAYIALPYADVAKFNLQPGDTQSLVDYVMQLKNVAIGAVVMEHRNHVRLSLRSIDEVAVNRLAQDYFSGGGHKNAAGGRSEESLSATLEKLVLKMEQLLKETNVPKNKLHSGLSK